MKEYKSANRPVYLVLEMFSSSYIHPFSTNQLIIHWNSYTEADWEGAGWIGGGTGQYRTPFHVKGPVVRATAYVIGLGYYTLHLNGNQVSSHELGAFTTFDRRVLYDTLDLTEHINEGLAGGKQVHHTISINVSGSIL